MARVVSIALALFLVIGVILFVQYDEARVTATDTQQPAPPTKHDAALDSTVRPYVSETETSRTPEAHSGASMIYQCQNDGETVFSDRPCGNVVAQTAVLAPATTPQRVRTYREQYNNLAANRPVVTSNGPVAIGMTTGSNKNKARCESLHQQIAQIDAQARQRNAPQWQDHLRAERHKVQDQIQREC